MVDDPRNLIKKAISARANAVAPYSHFSVGCVILTEDGHEIRGCNIEVSSYGLTLCAERVALFKALSDGHRKFTTIVIVADTSGVCYPCGACRQVIHDFAPAATVICANMHGDFEILKASDLLPHPFGPEDLT